ncbi:MULTISPECIES: cytochrome ubiquinol oxidase subunit I [Planococcus]|uniref:Cytochrome D ubiquinol oxidase subunit I n=2 Tax=Planococcus TaxID=1372 RepID=A0ABN4K0Q9_9BACL|nr:MULTISPECIES: cytochrome ubiquinol oxidase subunit I [Planococcus]ALS79391.1 cytochrome D ubiquinol oxidase subunit I [Planococcus kocurii]AQU78639.1 cytochrome ubiquinol oxidase subunit I [Planococcus faecalis]KAA0955094.1 cytochrome ubiquinol oxidase subunit I [Planococcus sp. ANT_H30]MDJ0333192.1 cytochrome ubiquinol oxidase subunit I [Planococcus sp. S3-L1]OHX54468.1 cytochrome D ubiquinol oxidase subunit I [Planococcus faecalis]
MEFQDPAFLSRILTLLTLSFHILYATIGVGVPLMIMIAQWVGIKKKDEHYILMARRWARGFVITVAVGVVTGTAIGLQLSLLWPNFMQLAGNVIALPLFMEVFAFFFEAIFLGIYLYTWDRFEDQRKHFLLLIPVALGAAASSVFITIVNAFMNQPQGFEILNGEMVNVSPLLAMFSPAVPTKVAHVMATAFMTSAFLLASIAAFRMLRGSTHIYHKKALFLTMKLALVFSVATALIGDFSGKYLAEYQPEKLAAAEWHFETEEDAGLVMFGVLDGEEVKYAIKIPYALSILAHSNPFAEVTGLNEFPEDEIPPLWIHYLFDTMVTIGMWLAFFSFVYVVAAWRNWSFIRTKWFRWLTVAGGPLALVAIEAGWWFTEVGRQPWILRGHMKIDEAATTSGHVDLMIVLFAGLYLILGIGTVVVLSRMYRRNPVEKELAARENGKGGEEE